MPYLKKWALVVIKIIGLRNSEGQNDQIVLHVNYVGLVRIKVIFPLFPTPTKDI